MSTFTFGFAGEDIEDPDLEVDEPDASVSAGIRELGMTDDPTHGNAQGQKQEHVGVLSEASYCQLDEMLATLPSQISYSMLPIISQSSSLGCPGLTIPRREVFDIRAQLMAEDDVASNENAKLIFGLEKEDIKPTVYEGGLKTWECAIDLAKLLAVEEMDSLLSETAKEDAEDIQIIELGAGTAIPSLSILHHILSQPPPLSPPHRTIRFVFADYNAAVLRLVTVPNILLTWHTCRSRLHQPKNLVENVHPNPESRNDIYYSFNHNEKPNKVADNDEQPDLDLDIDPALISSFQDDLRARGISLSFISGAWSPAFVELALATHPQTPDASAPSPKKSKLLILASETIYSPSSIHPFSETLLTLLHRGASGSASASEAAPTGVDSPSESKFKALIAAKKVYFGVGGGIEEFLDVMRDVTCRQGAESDGDGFFVKERVEVKDKGVGRVVLEVGV
ncbi:hypothetical protein GX48_01296 [Paracoccidioides brasiliensis]|nr:hypothetical protein GX48_01296 [Paracoccidioides brasiliensis]